MANDGHPLSPVQELTEAGREFYRRGWSRGASGNYSILLARKPMRLCITAAGNEKGTLDETNLVDAKNRLGRRLDRRSDDRFRHCSAIHQLRAGVDNPNHGGTRPDIDPPFPNQSRQTLIGGNAHVPGTLQ